MANTPRLDSVSPKRQRIAELARQASDMVFTSLAHHIDRDMLHAQGPFLANRKQTSEGRCTAVPVFVLTVPPQTVQRYRQRRPHFVGNEPWPTMLRPSFPRLSHPRLAHSTRFLIQSP